MILIIWKQHLASILFNLTDAYDQGHIIVKKGGYYDRT
jgi:hypothetical protein